MRIVLAAIFLVLAPTVAATAPAWSYQGAFLYGGLEAFYVADACAAGGLTDGINSDCFLLPAETIGKRWAIPEASDDTGVLAPTNNVDVPAEVHGQTQPTHCSIEDALRNDEGNTPTDLCHSSNVLIYPLVGVCFYTPAAAFPTGPLEIIGCSEQPVVPEGAGMAAVFSYPAVNVKFTFEVYEG